ncbi:MAG: tRNA 2-thiouridine(34) synthase MnmA [Patescibacteria group bacterium]
MKRVIALMSGGVDSSVAAALLQEQGYDVIGVYILGWTGTEEFPCSWQDEQADAAAVAKKLGIPFHTVNLSKEYEKEVIDQFFAGYNAGRTPNPDILCNREIKFKHLWKAVRQFEPDFVATGHYARLRRETRNPKSEIRNGFGFRNSTFEFPAPAIFKSRDVEKDQTYFLWGIDAAMLPKILFPLGDMTKKEVRALAKKYGLPTATKKDSQGICFVGPLKVREFLKSRVRHQPGGAVLPSGEVIAKHDGVELYTIGQRLGAGSVEWTGDVPPLFVVAKDSQSQTLVVSKDSDTYADQLIAENPNWHSLAGDSFQALAKIRYRQADVPVNVLVAKDKITVTFNQPVRAITPGQSIVFYSNQGKLLGGAVIASVPSADELVQKVDERQRSQAAYR